MDGQAPPRPPGAQRRLRAGKRSRFLLGSVLLGIGLGGSFDGIVLHQVLQWHHLVSTPVPADTLDRVAINTLADGLFHAVTWVVIVVGLFVVMASDGARHELHGTRTLGSGLLAGWGLFNLVEGVIDHHVLGLHHVRSGPDALVYDVAFLLWGAGMLAAGVVLGRRAATSASST